MRYICTISGQIFVRGYFYLGSLLSNGRRQIVSCKKSIRFAYFFLQRYSVKSSDVVGLKAGPSGPDPLEQSSLFALLRPYGPSHDGRVPALHMYLL